MNEIYCIEEFSEESKVAELKDEVNSDLIPYLLHFSDEDLIPEIRYVKKTGIIITERIDGRRLDDVLKSGEELDSIENIFRNLGESIGYITGNFSISHGDLTLNNVVVDFEDNFPYIIDWEEARYDENLCRGPELLLDDAERILYELGNDDWYKNLEKMYYNGMEEGRSKIQDQDMSKLV